MKNILKTTTILGILSILFLGVMIFIALFSGRSNNTSSSDYTITFVSPYGDLIEPITFERTYNLELPELDYPGFTFLGWFNGNQLVSDGVVNQSLVLQAKFERKTFVVSFDENIADSIQVLYGQEVILPIVDRPGFVFKGYFKDAQFTVPFDGTVVSNMTLFPKYDVLGNDIFAVYFISPFSGLIEERVITLNETLEDFPVLSKEGYNFIGWQVAGDDTPVQEGVVLNSNTVLVAVFESLIRTYTIRFNTGTDLVIPNAVVPEGTILQLPESPYIFGYQFVGWVTDITFDGFNVFSRRISEAFEVTKDMELFANFDYMIPSANIFYEPYRYDNKILGYRIVEITFETDDTIDYMILPQTYLGLPVVSVSSYAFEDIRYIKEVVVPEGYIDLNNSAFANSSIQIIHLPKSLEVIGDYAFRGSDIETILFPNGSQLVSIYRYAFADTENLVSFTVPATVRTIGENAFAESQLESIIFEANSQLYLIDEAAFEDTLLTEVDLPESLLVIQEDAFRYTSLTSIRFKKNIRFIGERSFANTPIETVTFDDTSNIKEVERNVFSNTPIIAGVEVLNIQGIVFGFDRNLQNVGIDVVIPEDVFFIARDAFSNVVIKSLEFKTTFVESMIRTFSNSTINQAFALPNSNKFYSTFDSTSFFDTFTLHIPNGASTYQYMFNYVSASQLVVSIDGLPEDANAQYMFYDANLKELILKSGVTKLDRYILSNAEIDHLIIESESLKLMEQSMRFRSLNTYELPVNFEFIPLHNRPFEDLRSVSNNFEVINGYRVFGNVLVDSVNVVSDDLVIPDGVTILNRYSILRNINTIDLNDTVYIFDTVFQYRDFGYNAFTLNLTPNVSHLSEYYNAEWSTTRQITLNIGDAFQPYITLGNPISKYSNLGKSIPFDAQGFRRLGTHIFDYDAENFSKDVVIPAGVKSIAYNTFAYMNITSLTSSEPINEIYSNAFYGNPNLRNVLVPQFYSDNGQVLSAYEMEVLPTLTNMHASQYRYFNLFYLSDAVYYGKIQRDAQGFYIYENILVDYDGNATEVVIPEGVIAIGQYAFSNSLVTKVTLPTTLQYIQEYAFNNTPRLDTLVFNPSMVLEYIGRSVVRGSKLTIFDLPNALNYHENFDNTDAITFSDND